jgi:hypothetical protein
MIKAAIIAEKTKDICKTLMLPLDINYRVMNLHTKFHFSMCNFCEENDWKLPIIGIFEVQGP